MSPFREYQKFWAFIALILAVIAVAGVSVLISAVNKDGSSTDPTVLQAKLAILNMAMGGIIGALGAASQAFFRHSITDENTASAVKDMAAALPLQPPPANDPVSDDAAAAAASTAQAATDRAEEIGAGNDIMER